MSKISDYFAQFEEQGRFCWSEDSEKRDETATLLLGAQIVRSLDFWLKLATDYIESNPLPGKFDVGTALGREHNYYRNSFAEFTTQEKEALLFLFKKIVYGAVFSTLNSFDNFQQGHLEVMVVDYKTDEKLATILPQEFELHDLFYEWVEKFSEYAELTWFN